MGIIAANIQDMDRQGPIMPIQIVPSAKVVEMVMAAGKPRPEPVKANVLVDTGASHSCVRKDLLAPLGLAPIGTGTISTASDQKCEVLIYRIRFIFLNGQMSHETSVNEVPELSGDLDGLLGRDILNKAMFVYDGLRKQFTLAI